MSLKTRRSPEGIVITETSPSGDIRAYRLNPDDTASYSTGHKRPWHPCRDVPKNVLDLADAFLQGEAEQPTKKPTKINPWWDPLKELQTREKRKAQYAQAVRRDRAKPPSTPD